MDNVITIPKKLASKGDLVVLSRPEYEEYLQYKKIIPLVKMSKSEREALKEGRKEIAKGEYLTLEELKDELGL